MLNAKLTAIKLSTWWNFYCFRSIIQELWTCADWSTLFHYGRGNLKLKISAGRPRRNDSRARILRHTIWLFVIVSLRETPDAVFPEDVAVKSQIFGILLSVYFHSKIPGSLKSTLIRQQISSTLQQFLPFLILLFLNSFLLHFGFYLPLTTRESINRITLTSLFFSHFFPFMLTKLFHY